MTRSDVFLVDQLKDPEYKDDPPNPETLAAIEEVRQMKQDPTLGKTYTDIDLMIQEALL